MLCSIAESRSNTFIVTRICANDSVQYKYTRWTKAGLTTCLSCDLIWCLRCLNNEEKEEVVLLRTQGDRHLCSLRKENLTSWKDPETERARHMFALTGSGDSDGWQPVSELPFRADKWCFTTAILYNYLYIIGGYRQQVKRGWEFKMASFRFNPLTCAWVATAPLIKVRQYFNSCLYNPDEISPHLFCLQHRRHFSAVACEGCIYAVGGWYLDSLVTPDSCTALYTAVERYDPWEDTWRFVSSSDDICLQPFYTQATSRFLLSDVVCYSKLKDQILTWIQ